MKFYEIEQALRECVDEETGEIDIERYEQLQGEKEKKLEGIALYTVELKEDANALTNQIKRLTQRRDALMNKRDRLRSFLARALNGEKLKTPFITVSSSIKPKLIIDNIDSIPAEFIQISEKKTVDTKKLEAAFGEWTVIAGAHIEDVPSVTIR